MNVRYDKEADALYIRLSDKPSVESEMIEPGIIVDYSADNQVVAIEILHVSQRLELLKTVKELAEAA